MIGAGFASGSEIAIYFLRHGGNFVIPLLLSCMIFAVFGKLTMNIAIKSRKFSYESFMDLVVGKWASKAICFFTGIFFFILFTAMISAFGTMMRGVFGINKNLGGILFLFICVPVLLKGADGVIKANCVLVPVLVAGIIICSAVSFGAGQGSPDCLSLAMPKRGALLSGASFAFYNMVSCVPVLIECAGDMREGKNISSGCVIAAALIFCLGVMMGTAILFSQTALSSEIPMLSAVRDLSKVIYLVYALSFTASVYTTAAGNGFCAFEWFLAGKKSTLLRICIFLSAAYVLSFLSFSIFVENMYSVFSLVGLAEFISLLFYCGKQKL